MTLIRYPCLRLPLTSVVQPVVSVSYPSFPGPGRLFVLSRYRLGPSVSGFSNLREIGSRGTSTQDVLLRTDYKVLNPSGCGSREGLDPSQEKERSLEDEGMEQGSWSDSPSCLGPSRDGF